jgi:hypothetical protein
MLEAAGYRIRQLPAGIGAASGTATHAGAAYTMTEKMTTGLLGNANEADQRTLQSLADEIEGGVMWDSTTGDLNTAQQQSLRQMRSFRTHVAPIVQPLAVETRLEAEFSPGFVLSGQPDYTVGDGIEDIKTGKTASYHGSQFGCYSALQRTTGQPVTKVRERFIRRMTLRKEQEPPVTHEYDPGACERLAWATLKDMERAYMAFTQTGDIGVFIPNPRSNLCSSKYCGAHGACCPHGRGTSEE